VAIPNRGALTMGFFFVLPCISSSHRRKAVNCSSPACRTLLPQSLTLASAASGTSISSEKPNTSVLGAKMNDVSSQSTSQVSEES